MTVAMRAVTSLAMAVVAPDPGQPRKVFAEVPLRELADSIAANGLLQPITVRAVAHGKYTLISGERRYRAHQILGRQTIEAIIMDVPTEEAKRLQLVENLNREDLNPIEMATAYKGFLDRGYGLAELSRITGRMQHMLVWVMSLLDLRPDIQDMVAKGTMGVVVGTHLAKLSQNGQMRALRAMNTDTLTVQECRMLCDRIWADEHQSDMMPETKLSEDALTVRRLAVNAFALACRALQELQEIEGQQPGSVAKAMVDQGISTDDKLAELEKGIRALRKALARERIAGLRI